MFVIPTWITNIVFLISFFLISFVLAAYQHWRLNRENPVTNFQFIMMVGSMLMLLVVPLFTRTDPWLSLAFLLTAAGSQSMTIHQHRKPLLSSAFE